VSEGWSIVPLPDAWNETVPAKSSDAPIAAIRENGRLSPEI
jgi:hypothetical protein